MSDAWAAILTIAAGAFALATIAVIVSKQANTAGVVQAASSGLGSIITAAVSPVTAGAGTANIGGVF